MPTNIHVHHNQVREVESIPHEDGYWEHKPSDTIKLWASINFEYKEGDRIADRVLDLLQDLRDLMEES